MTATEPTILAPSGGHRTGSRSRVLFDAPVHHAVELSGVDGRRPRVYVGTAIGDAEHFAARTAEAARVAGFDLTPLNLFPMPNVEDVEGALPTTHCTDDGVGLVYHGTRLAEAVTEIPGEGAYTVVCDGDSAFEERIGPRRLRPADR
jgi:hypothetical protein